MKLYGQTHYGDGKFQHTASAYVRLTGKGGEVRSCFKNAANKATVQRVGKRTKAGKAEAAVGFWD